MIEWPPHREMKHVSKQTFSKFINVFGRCKVIYER